MIITQIYISINAQKVSGSLKGSEVDDSSKAKDTASKSNSSEKSLYSIL